MAKPHIKSAASKMGMYKGFSVLLKAIYKRVGPANMQISDNAIVLIPFIKIVLLVRLVSVSMVVIFYCGTDIFIFVQ